jgi:hypothetical protein
MASTILAIIIATPIARLVFKAVQHMVVRASSEMCPSPDDAPRYDCPPRSVIIVSRGVGGKFGEAVIRAVDASTQTPRLWDTMHHKRRLPPDPRHHWMVLVGDVCHELSPQLTLDVTYHRGRLGAGKGLSFFEVGTTTWNDAAIIKAGRLHSSSLLALVPRLRCQYPHRQQSH